MCRNLTAVVNHFAVGFVEPDLGHAGHLVDAEKVGVPDNDYGGVHGTSGPSVGENIAVSFLSIKLSAQSHGVTIHVPHHFIQVAHCILASSAELEPICAHEHDQLELVEFFGHEMLKIFRIDERDGVGIIRIGHVVFKWKYLQFFCNNIGFLYS